MLFNDKILYFPKYALVLCISIGVHLFPKGDKVRELWETAVNRKKFKSTKHSRLCPNHFRSEDYIKEGFETDTEPIYESMVRDIAKSFGKPYPYETRMRIMGTTERGTAEIAIRELGLPLTIGEFLKIFHELSRQRLGDAKLLNGAERLLCHLHKNKIPFCLATSSSADMVVVKTRNYKELFDLFHHKVCGGSDPEVRRGKPSPDVFLVAASRFPDKPDPGACLVFEDAPNGVTAARAAGMQAVMVPDTHVHPNVCKHATQVLYSLEHFRPEQFGFKPFD